MPENSLHEIYPIDEVLQKKHWTLADAFRYCERLARNHYENFPVGSILIPKKLRPYVWAIYAFARRADDLADEDFPEDERLPALKAWQSLLEKSQRATVNHPVFLALRETLRQFDIAPQLLTDLITAFQWDVQVKRYPTFQDLLHYCRHSANPVGRLVLQLFGYRDEGRMRLSDFICSALQLANFWQDVAVDLRKNRIYIPQEDMHRFQYSEAELFALEYNPRYRDLLHFQVDRADRMFREGAPLVDSVKGRLRLELKCVVMGGMGILQKIRELDYDTLATRPHFNSRDKAALLLKALIGFRRRTRLGTAEENFSETSAASASEIEALPANEGKSG
ncbi:MAG TPA: squalene synthase HpnC [Deltaproteobacteria bacterium]|nr:squalene synthase HpnC [Deltaproteobacteria bacterium]